MKRVLMVAEKFPPFNMSGSARPFYFAKYLPELGYEPLVLSSTLLASETRDESLLGELPATVRVWRTPRVLFPLVFQLRRLSRQRGARPGGAPPKAASARPQPALIQRFQQLAWWLHWEADWSTLAVLVGRHLARQHAPDLVWASGPHFRNLAAAARLARAIQKPLIVDLRDPWTYGSLWSPPTPHVAEAERRWARRVLSQAARVIFTSPLTLDVMHERFRDLPREQWRVITNGFDEGPVEPLRELPDDRCLFRYIGALNERRHPDPLIIAFLRAAADPSFKRLCALEFIGNAGAHAHKAALAPGCAIRFVGAVSRKESLRYMFGSDVNVLLQTISEGQDVISGKAFEYLHANKPILAVVDPRGGDAWLMRESKAGRVVDWSDPDAISRELLACFKDWQSGVRSLGGGVAKRYSRRALAAELAAVFDEVLAAPRHG